MFKGLSMDGSVTNLYRLYTMNSTVNKWVLPMKVGAFRKKLTANRGRILKDRSHGGGE